MASPDVRLRRINFPPISFGVAQLPQTHIPARSWRTHKPYFPQLFRIRECVLSFGVVVKILSRSEFGTLESYLGCTWSGIGAANRRLTRAVQYVSRSDSVIISAIVGAEMAKQQKFSEIIERVERVRNRLALNKSRFSQSIGMRPQTYNNFVGSQGSKPNIELICGLINTYNVNPDWLLTGSGDIFTTDPPPLGNSDSLPDADLESNDRARSRFLNTLRSYMFQDPVGALRDIREAVDALDEKISQVQKD